METQVTKSSAGIVPEYEEDTMQTTSVHAIQGKKFVIDRVFREGARETIGTILLRLLRTDTESQ